MQRIKAKYLLYFNRSPQKNQELVKKAQKIKRKAVRRASIRRRKTEVRVEV